MKGILKNLRNLIILLKLNYGAVGNEIEEEGKSIDVDDAAIINSRL
jgi:hypothetical protein